MSSIFRSLSTTPRVPNPASPSAPSTGAFEWEMGSDLSGNPIALPKGAQSLTPTPSGGGGLPYVAPSSGGGGGAGGSTGSFVRSFTQPLAGALQSLGVKDGITANVLAGIIFIGALGGLAAWFFFFRKKR